MAVGVLDWLSAAVTQTFGQNGEKGIDFGINAGQPIGSPVAGKVTAVQCNQDSTGCKVQIADSGNRAWLFLHMQSVNPQIHTGSNISLGDLVGYSGGCIPGTYSGCCACTRYDQYSTGPHIEVRMAPTYVPSSNIWQQNWVDPRPVLYKIANGVKQHPDWNKTANQSIEGYPNQPNIYGDCAAAYSKAEAGLSAIDPQHITNGFIYMQCAATAGIKSAAVKVGLFLIALILVGFGGYVLFQHQIDTGAKTAVKGALLA